MDCKAHRGQCLDLSGGCIYDAISGGEGLLYDYSLKLCSYGLRVSSFSLTTALFSECQPDIRSETLWLPR